MEGLSVMENGIKDSPDSDFADMKKGMGIDEAATREQVLASEQFKVHPHGRPQQHVEPTCLLELVSRARFSIRHVLVCLLLDCHFVVAFLVSFFDCPQTIVPQAMKDQMISGSVEPYQQTIQECEQVVTLSKTFRAQIEASISSSKVLL